MSTPSFLEPVLLAALLTSMTGGCSEPAGPPDAAFAALRSAIADERWEQFYDVMTPETRVAYDELIAQKDAELTAIARAQGPSAADALLADIDLTHDAWKGLDPRLRFAAIFRVNARAHFMNMGLNPDHLRAADVRSREVRGDDATVVVDDGKGHRTRLRFRLVDGEWRFDPGDA